MRCVRTLPLSYAGGHPLSALTHLTQSAQPSHNNDIEETVSWRNVAITLIYPHESLDLHNSLYADIENGTK
jgi:hypothetical protein